MRERYLGVNVSNFDIKHINRRGSERINSWFSGKARDSARWRLNISKMRASVKNVTEGTVHCQD